MTQAALAALAALPSELEAIERTSGLTAVPLVAPEEARFEMLSGARRRVVEGRLSLLGYDAGAALLETSVRQFQAEAGLTVDGLVGDKTFGALQALVALEDRLDVAAWWPEDRQRPWPAFRRATTLRLRAFGLRADEVVYGDGADPRRDFDAFREVVRAILARGRDQPVDDREVLAFLHDHHLLLGALGDMRFIAPHRRAFPSSAVAVGALSPFEQLLRRVLAQVTRHALYLRGYDVGDLTARWRQDEVRAALLAYRTDVGKPHLRLAVSPDVLRSLAVEDGVRGRTRDDVDLAELEALLARDESWLCRALGRAATMAKEVTHGLFDGIGTAFAWIRRATGDLLGATLNATLDALLDLPSGAGLLRVLRVVFYYGSELLTVVKRGTLGLIRVAGCFFTGRLTGGPADAVSVRVAFRPDADAVVLAAPAASAADIEEVRSLVEAGGAILRSASIVLQAALAASSALVLHGGVATGWPFAIVELARRARVLLVEGATLARLLPALGMR